MILVGSDGHELGFGEDESFEVFRELRLLAFRGHTKHMKARLVSVHRVEDYLRRWDSALVVSVRSPGARLRDARLLIYLHVRYRPVGYW